MTETTDLRCWLYHPTHAPRIFHTPAEIEAALAEGWTDRPVLWPTVGSPPVVLPPQKGVSTTESTPLAPAREILTLKRKKNMVK